MPYELSFTKRIPITNREQYINDCCIGGDVVVEQLLPAVRARYTNVTSCQEDWGWFIWFRKNTVHLAIDIFTDDSDTGEFRILLTSRTKRMLVLNRVVDTPELDELRAFVVRELSPWVGGSIKVDTA
jgi:hypothetical protein